MILHTWGEVDLFCARRKVRVAVSSLRFYVCRVYVRASTVIEAVITICGSVFFDKNFQRFFCRNIFENII